MGKHNTTHFHKKTKEYSNENHQAFWGNTKFSVKTAKKFDTLDPRHPDHLESFEKFLDTLTSDTPHQLPTQPMFNNSAPSILDQNARITEDQWVVALIQKASHALVVIESIGSQGHRLDWFDFVAKYEPQPHSHGYNKLNRISFGLLNNPEIMLNMREIGMVRYCPTNNGEGLVNIPDDMTRKELFHKLNWNKHTLRWLVPVENVKAMLNDIRADYDKISAGMLKFKFCGHSAPRHSTVPGEHLSNCKTWAVNKLKSANIAIEIDEHNFINKIVAHKTAKLAR